MITSIDAVLSIARALLPVREAAPNRGRFVDTIIEFAGGTPPEPWCASFIYYCGRIALGSNWPLPKTRSCDVLLEYAIKKNLIAPLTVPSRGDLFLVMKSPTDAIHVGFVETLRADQGTLAFQTLEGNTNTDGSSNGIGVFRNVRNKIAGRTKYVFIRWSSV